MNDISPDSLDAATVARLRKLASRPVDLSRIQSVVGQRILPPGRNRIGLFGLRIGLIRAVAASILIGAVVVLLVFSLGNQAVMASPDRMAALHRELIGSTSQMSTVGSIAEAQSILDQGWSGGPGLPTVPAEHQVMACCVHAIGTKRIACVVIIVEGQQVSIAVGESDQIRMPQGPQVWLGGREFVWQSHEGFNMLMMRQGKRFVCVTSGLDRATLEGVVDQLKW